MTRTWADRAEGVRQMELAMVDLRAGDPGLAGELLDRILDALHLTETLCERPDPTYGDRVGRIDIHRNYRGALQGNYFTAVLRDESGAVVFTKRAGGRLNAVAGVLDEMRELAKEGRL